jgi:hypothetical protein
VAIKTHTRPDINACGVKILLDWNSSAVKRRSSPKETLDRPGLRTEYFEDICLVSYSIISSSSAVGRRAVKTARELLVSQTQAVWPI